MMEYIYSAPWPVSADGNDYFLEFINLNDDNSIASNWKESGTTSLENLGSFYDRVKVFPVPATSSISIMYDSGSINSYEITNLMGRKIISDTPFSKSIKIENLLPGTYFIEIHFVEGKTVVKRIIKN